MNLKVKSFKNRRGRRKNAKNISKSMRFMGVNAAGLRSKLFTFKKVLEELKPSVFFIEETKLKESGKIKFDNYIVFEKVRKTKVNGGGLAIGCVKELNPTWVREGEEEVEALSIDIFVQNMKIRCCVAYGCQENEEKEKKDLFWSYLDEEVSEASNTRAGLIIQFDGNLWAGDKIVPNDPRSQNKNGKLFEQFLARNSHLTVVNSLDICEGLITRSRFRNGEMEKSVLDFFVVCHLVLPHVTRMVVDEEKKFILTNYEQVRKGGKAADTDHATEFIDLDLKVITEKPIRREIWNMKNQESQNIFKKQTSQTVDFTKCFEDNLPLMEQIKNWRFVLKSHCYRAFKKIRITKKKRIKPFSRKAYKFINKRNQLLKNKADETEVEVLNGKISDIEAEFYRNKIMEQYQDISKNPENVSLNQVWKKMDKLWPKCGNSLPTAKKNHDGRIISAPNELKSLLAKEYKERLRTRPVRPDLKHLKKGKKRIFLMKLKLAESNKSKPWTLSDLDKALSDLKNNKSRDPEGFLNEIFKKNVIGTNLKHSMLLMFNRIRQKRLIPIFLNIANITTVPKRGSRLLLVNERGIFRVAVLRFILMRLVYNEKYPEVDSNMSDCQMGGRKHKGCRNNIFIVNGIIHDVMSSVKKSPVLLQIYDYRQMFDAINLEEAISDVYDAGVRDDNLALIYRANENINMAVNTPSGLSERQTITNVVLQGDTWSSLLASVQVDSIGKEVEKTGYGYRYKDVLPVTLLGLVDDMIGITDAGFKAQQLNAVLNARTADKQLQFGPTKCKTMLVSKKPEHVLNSQLTVDNWEVEYEKNTSTGESELVETFRGLVSIDKTDNKKYLGFTISRKGDNMVNINEMKNKSIWIIRKIFTRLESLNLKKYYFECALIFLNVMLRSSILYACEAYYNLKETEIRQIERIEEGFLRQLFKTSKGCPISQLYLEAGHTPARFYIFQSRLLFLKYILHEDPDSMIYKFFKLQMENPTKGDWVSSCVRDLEFLKIEMSIEEIKNISLNRFRNILKEAIAQKAFEYLIEKRGSKGQEISYTCLKMSDYLMPNSSGLSVTGQRYIFSVRNKMIFLPANFPLNMKETNMKCACGDKEDMRHVYVCTHWNTEREEIEYDMIYTDNISQIVKVYKRFEKNYQTREKYRSENNEKTESEKITLHGIPNRDPLLSLFETCNGFK